MNNSINSDLSFKANLVTTLKGNKNIMKPIAEEFAKITKKTQGDFYISRASEVAKAHLKEFEYKGVSLVTDKLNDDLSKDPEKIGKRGIKVIARKLADIFYSLKAENTYKEKINSYAEDIFNLKTKIKDLSKLKADSEKFGMQELADRYNIAIENCKNEINILKEKATRAQKYFVATMDKYPDNEVVDLQKSIVVDDFKYDLNSALRMTEIMKRK